MSAPHILTFRKLNPLRLRQIKQLLNACTLADTVLPEYPLHEPDTVHYLICQGKQMLGALAFCRIDAETCESVAFVHPDFRRQGIFKRLLNAALPDYEDKDILFVCAGALPDSPLAPEFPVSFPAASALHSLDAEPESMELLMECSIASDFVPRPLAHTDLTVDIRSASRTAMNVSLLKDSCCIGKAGLAVFGCGLCVLHDIEIDEALRKEGYGGDFMQLLLTELSNIHFETISLQVHGGNTAAIRLYKKTGFRICKILSYYLY